MNALIALINETKELGDEPAQRKIVIAFVNHKLMWRAKIGKKHSCRLIPRKICVFYAVPASSCVINRLSNMLMRAMWSFFGLPHRVIVHEPNE